MFRYYITVTYIHYTYQMENVTRNAKTRIGLIGF